MPALLFRWFDKTIPVNTYNASADVVEKKLNNETNNHTFRVHDDPPINVTFRNGTSMIVNQTLGCHYTELHPYGDFYRMTMPDRLELIRDNQLAMFWGAVLLVLLLLGSHMGSILHARFFNITEV